MAGDDERTELLGYGLMVEAAYLTYDAVTKQPGGGECYEAVLSGELDKLIVTAGEDASRRRRRHVVTAHFFATIEPLHAVVDALPVVGGVDKTYWLGYVAVARRGDCWDVVVAWRGSASFADWMMDMRVMDLVDFGAGAGRVAEGFYNVYTSKDKKEKHGTVSAKEQVVMEVKRLVDHLRRRSGAVGEKPVKVRVTVTGHSLGGALAVMTAHDVTAALAADADADTEGVRVRAVTFGAPRVGDDAFRRAVAARGVEVFRVIVKQDIVPKLPMGDEYADAGDGDYDIIELDDGGNWLSPLEMIRTHSLDLYLQLITLRNPAITSVLSNSNSDAPPPPPPAAKEEWKDMMEEEGYMRLPLPKLKEELDKLEGPSPKK
uniref:Fungal lipase-type domain-containing protein n=1 Tax=Oryza meridionalis TaxID=40149 RepID=A0A0E0FEE4_9ORYZ